MAPAYGHHGHHKSKREASANPKYGYGYVKKSLLTYRKFRNTASFSFSVPRLSSNSLCHGRKKSSKCICRSYTHCKEIEQETCYNLPVVTNEEMEVTLAFPEATRDVI